MITSLHIFYKGFAKATIECHDGTTVEITLPSEALEGLSIEERTERIMLKARNYMKANCIVVPDGKNDDVAP